MIQKSIRLFGREILRVERNRAGQFIYSFLDDNSGFTNSDKYLDLMLNNPVLLTIGLLRSRIYSQMQIKHVNSKGIEIENSPYIKLLNTPNYFQSREDWLFQQMFFLSAVGTNFVYEIKPFTNDLPKAIYNLVPSEIEFNNAHKIDKFIVTDKDKKAFGERVIKYTLDKKVYYLKLNTLTPLYDLSNGLTNNSFFTSPSRLKGNTKVVENIEQNLYSKNKNLKMSQKYIGLNKSTGNEAQIQDKDRKSIEGKIEANSLILSNANVDVKHLVSDFKKLYLDEQFADDANKLLLAYEMNKNVLNYFAKDSTFENQNQGFISWIQNSIQTSADNNMNSLAQQWGLFERGERLVASYDHLPVMQSVMNEKIKSFTEMQNAIKIGIENGTITQAEAKQMSDAFKLKLKL